MRVTLCIDALQPHLSGIGRYTWELCKGLVSRPDIKPSFYRGGYLFDDPAKFLRADGSSLGGFRQLRWLQRQGAKRMLRSNLVHGPNYFLPPDAPSGIITIHDLSVLRFPETHPIARVKSFEKQFDSSLSRAAHVITDTETVRRELIEAFSIAPETVTAVPLGVEGRFRPIPVDHVQPVLAHLGLQARQYGLTVAALEPRKRLSELMAAWRELPMPLRNRYPLVLAGTPGWRNEGLQDAIAQGQAEGWIKHPGYVDDALLPSLYAGARLFVYPSTYEGFGLPPIEAMASGTPVLVSDQSCLPEVCGDAAGFVDPDDRAALTVAIEEGLIDEDLRAERVRAGLARAALYTWDRCVADTVAIYRKLAP